MGTTREVVITGVGVVSPIGIGRDAFWESLVRQRSGVRRLTFFDPRFLPVQIGGEITDFDPKLYVKPRKSIKVMGREIQLGFSAAALAVEDATLDTTVVDPDRFGVVFGSEMLYCDIGELEDLYRSCMDGGHFRSERFGGRIVADLHPLWMLKNLPNMAACHIGIANDARGPNNTIVQGDVSSLLALAESVAVIQRGHADLMITGGVGSRISITPLVYRGDYNLSHRNADPAGACRPFDKDRDGTVIGEGAAAFILETRRHAEQRGANVIAEVAATSCGIEPVVSFQPLQGTAIIRTIESCLASAGTEPQSIGHVNAHGMGTIHDDITEARAISRILGDVPVTAPKSYFGHLGAGSGAVEMAVSVLSLEHGLVPATLNYQTPDSQCPVHVIHDEPIESAQNDCLILNQASTGHAAAALLRNVR